MQLPRTIYISKKTLARDFVESVSMSVTPAFVTPTKIHIICVYANDW